MRSRTRLILHDHSGTKPTHFVSFMVDLTPAQVSALVQKALAGHLVSGKKGPRSAQIGGSDPSTETVKGGEGVSG